MHLQKVENAGGIPQWKIFIGTEGTFYFTLYVFSNAGVRSRYDHIENSVSFGYHVSIGMPVSQLGDFLERRCSPEWWKKGEAAYSYPDMTPEYLDDETRSVCPGHSVKKSEDPEKIKLADIAYNYIMSLVIFALDREEHPLPAVGHPVLEADEKSKWSVLPRSAPLETAKALADMAEINWEEFVSLIDERFVRKGDLQRGWGFDELKERVFSIAGLTHTTVSGVTVNGETAVVLEKRDNGVEYMDFLCDTVSIG